MAEKGDEDDDEAEGDGPRAAGDERTMAGEGHKLFFVGEGDSGAGEVDEPIQAGAGIAGEGAAAGTSNDAEGDDCARQCDTTLRARLDGGTTTSGTSPLAQSM